MKHRNSHLLVGYWSRLRRGRAVPDQTEIDPRAIKRMLSYVFILDAADTARPVYRLAGTSVCERYGSELRGTNFFTHWEAQSRGALSLLLKQALDTRQPVCLSSVAATADCAMVEIETVLAPIKFGDGGFGEGAPTRFIGLMQITSDASQLIGRPIAFERLVGSKIVREDEPLSTYDPPPPPPPPPSIRPTLRSHPKAPHLRLVVSREKGVTLHAEMDEPMLRLIEALDIMTAPPPALIRVR
ncbi:MAG: PAS domain-containing protein [Alphaproteobacteria bacterium]|nr:PAS domain-containing protein [Alphaproteobacteria bacterium]MBU6471109.1 PAS domain-containing protein [Alphaproteobacteria bacterium]MDE2012186.1 PAS domain-containing protein [Alphaproteobacteria bacterium]MDE2072199.1 PAS domain-containing protein [Alphaproteobacteria bacterium]MDE2351752.1 PAS domain-containing protein [Alphaproteobacteria bacterium]